MLLCMLCRYISINFQYDISSPLLRNKTKKYYYKFSSLRHIWFQFHGTFGLVINLLANAFWWRNIWWFFLQIISLQILLLRIQMLDKYRYNIILHKYFNIFFPFNEKLRTFLITSNTEPNNSRLIMKEKICTCRKIWLI